MHMNNQRCELSHYPLPAHREQNTLTYTHGFVDSGQLLIYGRNAEQKKNPDPVRVESNNDFAHVNLKRMWKSILHHRRDGWQSTSSHDTRCQNVWRRANVCQ